MVRRRVSAQHGGRLDSNLSGLCHQQIGGGSRGVAARAGVLEQGPAGFTAIKYSFTFITVAFKRQSEEKNTVEIQEKNEK